MFDIGTFFSKRSFLLRKRICGKKCVSIWPIIRQFICKLVESLAVHQGKICGEWARTIDVCLNHCEWHIESHIVIASCIWFWSRCWKWLGKKNGKRYILRPCLPPDIDRNRSNSPRIRYWWLPGNNESIFFVHSSDPRRQPLIARFPVGETKFRWYRSYVLDIGLCLVPWVDSSLGRADQYLRRNMVGYTTGAVNDMSSVTGATTYFSGRAASFPLS